jgi:hypothetical protein
MKIKHGRETESECSVSAAPSEVYKLVATQASRKQYVSPQHRAFLQQLT